MGTRSIASGGGIWPKRSWHCLGLFQTNPMQIPEQPCSGASTGYTTSCEGFFGRTPLEDSLGSGDICVN